MVKVVIDGNRLFMEHAQETLEMLEHKHWYTDAATQNANTDAATQNANTDAATQVRTQMLAESQMLKHDCWNTTAET
jgi:hypothetical protein